MSFTSWLTGRDEKESDVYANYDKVESVVSNIKNISNNEVESARNAVHTAINNLNNVNGLAQFVGSVDAGAFDGIFESIASTIVQIGEQVQNKANDIKTYEESAWYEKLGSTFAMAGAKFGEGILSVAEDLGDGVVSVAGWIAPKDSGFEKACEDFVKKEWSHDAFNFYYNSEFAKKSTFTEDSAAAAGFKIAGATTGYLYLGGVASGMAEGAGVATKGTKAAKAANLFFGNTTRANTTIAAVTGMGSGTESGLRQGKSFDQAAWGGAKQGVAQGAVAYGFGKLGEKSAQKAKDKAISQAQDKVDDVSKQLSKAEDTFDSIKKDVKNYANDIKDGKVLGSKEDLNRQLNSYGQQGRKAQDEVIRLTNSLDDANNALNEAKNIKIQGYNDAITKAGQKSGAKYAQNIAENGFIKGTAKTVVTDPIKAGVSGAKNLGGKAVDAAKTFRSDPGTAVSTVKEGAKNTGTAAINTAKSTPGKIKAAGSTVLDAAKHPVQTAKAGAGAVKNAVTSSPSAPGVIGATANAAGREIVNSKGKATEQFKNSTTINKATGDSVKINTDVNYTPGKNPTVTNNNPQPGGGTNNNGGGAVPNNTSGGISSGGGHSNGGGYSSGVGGSPSGGAPTVISSAIPSTGNEQFKHNTNTDNKDQNEAENNKKKDPVTNNDNNKTPTTPTNPTNPSNPDKNTNNNPTVVTKPSNPGTNQTQHTGGGYSGSGGYRGGSTYTATGGANNGMTSGGEPTAPIEDVTGDATASIDDVIKGSKYTKIPTSSKPITTASGSGGSAVIPVVAGLSAAAAAGIGAKVYMDRKKNNENGEYDEIDTEEWSGEDTLNLDYDDSTDTETYLDDDDDYGYQAEEQTERYDARNNEELADLQ